MLRHRRPPIQTPGRPPRALQVAGSPAEGVAMAREAQESGRAGEVLARWIATSQAEAAKEKAAA